MPRRPNSFTQDKDRLDTALTAAQAATGSTWLGTVDGDYVVDKFEVEIPGGYTADDTNYYTITLQAGAVVLATLTLKITGGFGNVVDLVGAAATLAANPTGASGDNLKVVMTKTAAAVNLPIGTRFVAHIHQL